MILKQGNETIVAYHVTEAFDIVRDHLLTQKTPSLAERADSTAPRCVYRNPKGLKCAIGALIPDEMYTPYIEGKSVETLLMSGVDVGERHYHFRVYRDDIEETPSIDVITFMESLQHIHDRGNPDTWEFRLKNLRHEYKSMFT